jgi:hypothetical protein
MKKLKSCLLFILIFFLRSKDVFFVFVLFFVSLVFFLEDLVKKKKKNYNSKKDKEQKEKNQIKIKKTDNKKKNPILKIIFAFFK